MLFDRVNDDAAAMSFTSPKLLTPEHVASVVCDVVARPRLHVVIPGARGFGARLVGLLPNANVFVTRLLAARGRQVQAKMRGTNLHSAPATERAR
jgi:hypothetical protein